jgi:hypothetical protein
MNNTRYYLYRIKLEKLKQRTWALIIVARVLVFLALVIDCLRQ